MPKINFLTPSLALIIVAMGFFIAWQCESAKNQNLERTADNHRSQQRIAELQAQARNAGHRMVQLEGERIRMRDSIKVAHSGLKIEIRRYKESIAKLRPILQPKIDSFPELGDLISKQDAVIKAQDSLIVALELAHSAEIVNLEKQLSTRADMILIEATKGDLWRQVAVKVEKEANQQRRRKGFWKVTSAILAGGIVWISLKE